MPYKAENWHALSDEKYFSTQCFLDVFPWFFNENYVEYYLNLFFDI